MIRSIFATLTSAALLTVVLVQDAAAVTLSVTSSPVTIGGDITFDWTRTSTDPAAFFTVIHAGNQFSPLVEIDSEGATSGTYNGPFNSIALSPGTHVVQGWENNVIISNDETPLATSNEFELIN